MVDDTHPEIHRRQIEGYRRMSAADKLRCVGNMYDFAMKLAMADVKRRFPDAEEEECRIRTASRWLDRELLKRAFGWSPDERRR